MRICVNVPNFGPGTGPGVLRRWEAANSPFGFLLAAPDGGVLAEEPNTAVTVADIPRLPQAEVLRPDTEHAGRAR